jgi:hypothetical protein
MATLEITVHGLCLFVPYKTAMYVLMPQTGPTVNYGKVVKHESMLHIDHRYYLSGDPRPKIPIDGYQLDISSPTGSGVDPTLPCGVVDLTEFSTLRVPKDSLDRNLFNTVNSRIVLTDGSMQAPKKVACWQLPQTAQIAGMADTVIWSIPLNTSPAQVVLRLNNLNSGTGSGTTLVELQEDHGKIEFGIRHHVKGTDTPFGHQPGEAPPHFEGFYFLLESPYNTLPGYDPAGNCGCKDARVATLDSGIVPPTSTIYTCMVAGAQPGP